MNNENDFISFYREIVFLAQQIAIYEKDVLRLTVFFRQDATVNGVKLAMPDLEVGILSVAHHGIEEVFFISVVPGKQDNIISIRHRQNEISPYLHWIRANLSCWQTSDDIVLLEGFLTEYD